MRFFKKAIAIIASISLFSSQMLWADGQWFKPAYGNITSPQEYSNGEGVGFSFGSIEYRFSNSGVNWKPWVDFKGPKLKAGCNGISLSGGFIEFAGLEDIGEQLANASQALIYGILIAIVNSLPSLEHVFSKIKEVVNWLQDMLKNACNVGKAIGNATMNSPAMKGFKDASDQITSALDNVGDSLVGDYMKVSPEDLQDKLTKLFTGSNSSSTSASEDIKVKDQAREVAGSAFTVGGTIGMASETLFEKENYSTNGGFGEIKEITIGEGKITPAEEIYLILANLIGDDGASQNTANFLLSQVSNAFPELLAKGKISDHKQAEDLAGRIANFMKNESKPESFSYEIYIPPRWSGSRFVSEIINGPTNKSGEIEVTKMKAIIGWATSKGKQPSDSPDKDVGGNKTYKLLIPNGWATKGKGYDTVKIKWKGLKEESREAIYCFLKLSEKTCNAGDQQKILDPSIVQKIQGVAELLEAKADASGQKIEKSQLMRHLKASIDQLALLNSYYILKFVLLDIKDRIVVNSDKVTDKDIGYYGRRTKQIDGILTEVENQIIKDLNIAKTVNEFYDQIKRELNSMKSKGQQR